jgi:hypothetical protein
MTNELKLMFADNLELDDINTLVRTSQAMNQLLNPYLYRRARHLYSRCGRPYFLRAVDLGNITAVRHFLEVGTSVNMCDPNNSFVRTSLFSCLQDGNIEIARLLINNGVNISATNELGWTPLHFAVRHWAPSEAMVTLLLDAGADISAPCRFFPTILYTATWFAPTSIVQLLLHRGADPNIREENGCTLLHFAAIHGTAATVRIILEAGLNIETTNDSGETALHCAARLDRHYAVEALLECGANVHAVNNEGLTPLQAFFKWNSRPGRKESHMARSNPRSREDSQASFPKSLFYEFDEPTINLLLSAGSNIWANRYSTPSALDWATCWEKRH